MVLLVAVTLAVHGNTLWNGFVWDDETIIVKNPDTRDLSRLPKVLLSPDERPPYYRPLNRASYLLDYRAFGLSPTGFHAVNVALQVACVLALYGLGRRLFRDRAAALVTALLLAVHPIGSEVVAFVTARNNLFALLFSILSLSLFVDASRRGSWSRALLSALALFLGLLGKEPAAMTLPVMGVWILAGDVPRDSRLRAVRFLLPHLVLLGVYLALRAISLGGPVAGSPGAAVPHAGLLERLGANFFTIPTYVGLLLFPRGLTIYHVLPERDGLTLAVFAAAWVAVGIALVLLLRRRSPPTTLGLAWFAFGLLPASNLLALPTATVLAERYAFLPAVGLWIVAGDLFQSLETRRTRRPWLYGAAAAALLALGVRTVVRNRDWKDDLTLARAAVEVEPRAPMAQYNLGLALKERGDVEGARRAWERSVLVDRVDGRAAIGLGILAAEAGDAATAERFYRSALPTLSGPVEAHLNLGKLYDRMGSPHRAREEWEAVLRSDPDHPDALAQLGALDAARGDLRSAEARFRRALRADPSMSEALFNLAQVLEATGRTGEAITAFERLLRMSPPPPPETARMASQRLSRLRSPRPP